MAGNSSLKQAKIVKNDEFYTQITDIEKELKHYKDHFKDKVVYCNCDDPRASNFFKYFYANFDNLGLKKIISSCYKNQDIDLFSRHDNERACYIEYTGDKNGNKIPDKEEISVKYFDGDGDFRSKESIDLLKQADIVVTNPPFSLFIEYVAQLVEYDKKFLIIGNKNAIANNDIFPLIKDKKIWMGVSSPDHFKTPNDELTTKLKGLCRWFTNLDYPKRHEDIMLYETYTPEKYPKYINYDAINVNKMKDIPKDYDGVMGVPITFFDNYNPDQFEIIGLSKSNKFFTPTMNFVNPVMFSKNKESDGGTINTKLTLNVQEKPANNAYYKADNVDGYLVVPYTRLLIKRR